MSIDKKTGQSSMETKLLLTAGMLAGPLFTILWIIESVTRTDYDPLRHPVSSLALGEFGWMQIANFMIAGLLSIAFALGLWFARRSQKGSIWGPLLVAIWGMGLLGAGVFITDPVSGYPPGTPNMLQVSTPAGALHDQLSLVGFAALTAACFVFRYRFAARGERGWAFYSLMTGILFPIGIVLASAAFSQNASLVAFGGLIQRITITLGWTWLTLLAIHVLRDLPEMSTSQA
jgi:hypothetical protein